MWVLEVSVGWQPGVDIVIWTLVTQRTKWTLVTRQPPRVRSRLFGRSLHSRTLSTMMIMIWGELVAWQLDNWKCLWIHIILLKSKSSFPSPFLIAPIPNAIRRPLQSPLFQALLVAVPSRGKGGGQLHSSSWSVGVVLISWQAGPGCRLHWHLHLSLSPPFLIEFLPFSILLCGQLQVQEVQVVGGWHPLPHLLVLLVLPLLLAHPASMHLTPAVPPAVWDSCCIYPHLASTRSRLATDAVLFSDCWLVKDNRLCDNTDWERQVSYSLRNFHPDLWQAVAQENEAEDYSW